MKASLYLIGLTAMIAAAVLCGGCGTLQKLGVTEDFVVTIARSTLEKEGYGAYVTDDQLKEIVTIVKANERLNALATEITSQAAVSNKIEAMIEKYVAAGIITLPKAEAPK